jgi:hypothetical protein
LQTFAGTIAVVARSYESLWLWLGGGFIAVGAALLGVAAGFDSASKVSYSFWTSVPLTIAYIMFGVALACFACAIREVPIPYPISRRSVDQSTPLAEVQAVERQSEVSAPPEPDTASASRRGFVGDLIGALFATPLPEDVVQQAIDDTFGGTFSTWANPSAAREIGYKGVSFPFGAGPDHEVEVPLCVVQAQPPGVALLLSDWTDWTSSVERDIGANYSLLVTEKPPGDDLRSALTAEAEDVWYDIRWFDRGGPGHEEPALSRLDVVVYLSPASSFSERRKRLNAAREVFHRHLIAQRDREVDRQRERTRRAAALSLSPGDSVEHDAFGQGTVISTTGYGAEATAEIDFGAEVGVKNLLVGYAPLRKL